jgi:opacity protein-like surface antigen|tara:strand:- start:254 stop:859 length:606 start_codon:yes stop_codon:yes gene_type:complete
MFKKTLLAVTLVGISAVPALSQAQEATPYLFASIGQSDSDLPQGDLDNYWGVPGFATSSVDSEDTAWKVGAGLKLNQYFAFELEYLDLGEPVYKATDGISVARTTASTTGYGLNGVLTLPLDAFSLFTKVGYHRLETDADFTFNGADIESTSDEEWVWSWGVGAAYSFNDKVSLVAEFERYRDVADYYDVDLMSAGLRYNF